MNPKQNLLQLAEKTWPAINLASQVTPDSLLLLLTSCPDHSFDSIHLDDATDIVRKFLTHMEKYNCVKRHSNFTKKAPIYIKTSNEMKRAKYRKYCDVLNTFQCGYTFTSTEFLNRVNKHFGMNVAKKDVSSFLSRATFEGYLISGTIIKPGFGGDKTKYFKERDIPEVEMHVLTANYRYRTRIEKSCGTVVKVLPERPHPIPSEESASAFDVFQVLNDQKAEITRLKQELSKAIQDAKAHAQREADANAQAAQYQEELNYIKQQTGAVLSDKQLDSFRVQ